MTSISISNDIVVPCPEISFRGRRAVRCLDCRHFHGVIDVMPDAPADTPFEQRYRIGCAHIVARRVSSIEVEQE